MSHDLGERAVAWVEETSIRDSRRPSVQSRPVTSQCSEMASAAPGGSRLQHHVGREELWAEPLQGLHLELTAPGRRPGPP